MNRPEQQTLPGIPAPTPPDTRHPDIEASLELMLTERHDARMAGQRSRDARDATLTLMATHGYERYEFTDPVSGKRRHLIADKTPRAKLVAAPKASTVNDLYDDEAAIAAKVANEEATDDKVEHRKVSRAQARRDLREAGTDIDRDADPFAATRGQMEH